MAQTIQWCVSRLAILKWIETLCNLIAVLFLMDGRMQWTVYTVIFAVCIALLLITVFTLVMYYFEVQANGQQVPWVKLELAFNVFAALFCLIATAILAYDFVQMASGHFQHHRYLPPANIGQDGWRNKIAVVGGFLLLNTVIYLISAGRTRKYGIA